MFPERYVECRDKKNKLSSVISAISRDVRRTFPIFQANIPHFDRRPLVTPNGSKASAAYGPHEMALFNVLSALSVAMPGNYPVPYETGSI